MVNTKLPCEFGARVEDAAVSKAKMARTQLKQLIGDSSIGSADVLCKVIRSKSANLLSTDRKFKLELALFNDLTRDDADSKLHAAMLDELPSAEHKPSPEQCLQALSALGGSQIFKFSARGAQGQLKSVQNTIKAIHDARVFNYKVLVPNVFMQKVLARCAWFLSTKVSAANVFGADAAKHLLEHVRKAALKDKATDAEVNKLRVFAWLLEEPAVQELHELSIKLSAKADAQAASSKGASSSSSGAAAPAAKDKKKTEKASKQAATAAAKAKSMFD